MWLPCELVMAGRPPAFLDPPFPPPLARWWSSRRVIGNPEKPNPPYARALLPEEERGLGPFCSFSLPFSFGLLAHSTKIASLNSISYFKPNR